MVAHTKPEAIASVLKILSIIPFPSGLPKKFFSIVVSIQSLAHTSLVIGWDGIGDSNFR